MSASLYSDKRFLLFIELWWLLVMVMQYVILKQADVDSYHAAIDSIASNLLLALMCYLLSNNMRYYLPRREKYWYILISSVVICLLWLISLLIVFLLIFPADDPYIDFFKQSSGIRLGAAFLMASSLTMFSLLLYSQNEQKELQAREAEVKELSKEGELFKLRQQLQPHFLFNSLNSISALTGSNPKKAREMIQQLSEFLRGMLRKDDEKMISLQDELKYIHLYLEIEKVRFGHRLQTSITCSNEAQKCVLPPLVLQPVIENAIKFGLYDTTGDVLIRIDADVLHNDLKIQVTNPFDPVTGQPAKGTGFGISSIGRRLFLIFSRTDLVKTRTQDDNFITEILIPQL